MTRFPDTAAFIEPSDSPSATDAELFAGRETRRRLGASALGEFVRTLHSLRDSRAPTTVLGTLVPGIPMSAAEVEARLDSAIPPADIAAMLSDLTEAGVLIVSDDHGVSRFNVAPPELLLITD